MDTLAVVFEEPGKVRVRPVGLVEPAAGDLLVEIEWSGISTGTERLLWAGRMPRFPGMGYPLVPGYEAVGRVAAAGPDAPFAVGQQVFVPGSTGFVDARGLFGGAARRIVAPGAKAIAISEGFGARGVLIALAATACHAIAAGTQPPDLIVGHGVLGRLLARVAIAQGATAPTVWEVDPARASGAAGYAVIDPSSDQRRDYRAIYDASGAGDLLNELIMRIARGGEIVLAGFYEAPLSFDFPPAFMREARLRVAAEFTPQDVAEAAALADSGALSLDGLISECSPVKDAEGAYRAAFEDPGCLKMVLDWRACA